jgi:hypothetical protein
VVKASINKWTQILCEELDMEIQGTWYNIQVTKTLVEATRREFGTWLVEVEAQVGYKCIRNTATRADKIKPPRFDGSMSVIFSLPIKAIVGAQQLTDWEKATHLMVALQGYAVNVLQSALAETRYEDIIEAPQSRYGDQLNMAFHSQPKART